jgi:hypothetical protein
MQQCQKKLHGSDKCPKELANVCGLLLTLALFDTF